MQTNNGYQNYDKMSGKEASDAVTRQIAELIERDVLELTGILKLKNERYYDYMKRAFTTVFEAQQRKIEHLQNNK